MSVISIETQYILVLAFICCLKTYFGYKYGTMMLSIIAAD